MLAWFTFAYDRSPLSRCTTGLNCSIWFVAVIALTDDLDQAGLPEPMSPKLVNRNGTRPAGAVVNVPCTPAAPSLSTSYTYVRPGRRPRILACCRYVSTPPKSV